MSVKTVGLDFWITYEQHITPEDAIGHARGALRKLHREGTSGVTLVRAS